MGYLNIKDSSLGARRGMGNQEPTIVERSPIHIELQGVNE